MKGRLDLTATDLDNSLIVSVPSPSTPTLNVDVLVPAKDLYQAVKNETAPTVEIKIHDSKFEVHANRRVVELPFVEPKNSPRIPDGELSFRGQILASALEAALNKAAFCLSAESTQHCTDTIKLEMRESKFRVVGTDGHRVSVVLSVVEGAAKNGTNSEFSTLLLRSTAAILSKLSGESSWVKLSTCREETEHNLFLLSDGSMLIARPSQGQFPNYENVIPKAPLESRHARVLGKSRDIGLNHQYLTQYVKSIETETVSMKLFPKAISEVVVFDAFRYQHLLMPMRD